MDFKFDQQLFAVGDPVVVDQPGQVLGAGDALALYLKRFGGEVLAAFSRASKTTGRHMTRNIENGKSASFPVLGRTKARYLASGDSLDKNRDKILSNEVINLP